jgi:hypothetical protein
VQMDAVEQLHRDRADGFANAVAPLTHRRPAERSAPGPGVYRTIRSSTTPSTGSAIVSE